MMPSFFAAVLLILFTFTGASAQRGWPMDGFDPARTNVAPASGPVVNPRFEVIASNVSGTLKRIANDGSLVLADGRTISYYESTGRLRWQIDVASALGGRVVDLALASSGSIYASSDSAVLSLDPGTGAANWPAPFVANSGNESGPLIVGSDGTAYFHTGSITAGFQERLTAINPDGTRKWEYEGNTGRGSGRVVLSVDGSTVYLYQLRVPGDSGKAIGLASASGERIYETLCDVKGGVYAYTPKNVLYTGASNDNLLKSPPMMQNCSVLTSGSTVTDIAAALNSGLLIIQKLLPGSGSTYAAIDPQGHTLWSRNEPLTGGFASASGESSGTFYAIAPLTNEVVAIRIATGEELWRRQFSASVSGLLPGGDRNLYLVAGTELIRAQSTLSDSDIVPPIAPSVAPSKPVPVPHLASHAGKLMDSAIRFDVTGGPSPLAAFAFDEGSGSVTADLSGNGFNGTLVNGAGWATGKNGNSVSLDGVNDKISLPSTLDIPALPFTVEAWVRPSNFAHWLAIFSKRNANSASQMRFDVGLATSSGRVYVYSYSSFDMFGYAPPVNVWTHLAVVADSNGTRLFVNGVLQQTMAVMTLGTRGDAPVNIGGTGDNDDPFTGSIDDFRLYNVALAPADIQSDMNTPVPSGAPLLHITQPAASSTVFGSTVNVTYSASGDLTEANHVHFQLDGNPIVMDMTFDGVYQFTNVPTGPHVLQGFLVRIDHSKIDGSDDSVSFTTSLPDTVPPTVSMATPTNGAAVTGTAGLTATAADNTGVAGVQFFLDGLALGGEDTSAPYATTWNTVTASNGAHVLSARARDLAGNLADSTPISVDVFNTGPNSPAIVGQWSTPAAWPLVSVHLTVLPTGKVLAWDNSLDHTDHSAATMLWDPLTNTFTDVSSPLNIFCSGQTLLPDGRVIVVGGHIDNDIGINAVSVFDPFQLTWSSLAPMSFARWYPSATTLADGRILAQLGTSTCKNCVSGTPEVYDPVANTWQQLPGAASAYTLYYPQTFPLPNGKVLVAGSSQYAIPSRVLDIATQSWTVIDPNFHEGGFYAMYSPGKIMRAGGPWDDGYGFPTTDTAVLDMTAGNPAWRLTAPMAIPRVLDDLTILPDGTVLSTGGSSDAATNPPPSAILYPAELWNPDSETWTTMASMQTQRLYHSTAVLLPDGRVLVSGSGRAFTADQFNAEIYSPPYLFKGARPTIVSAPAQGSYGSTVFVGTPDGPQIVKVSLVGLSAVTHTTNFNQRYVALTFQQTAGGLNVTFPASGNFAPPGYYMLFIVDANGIPSVASFVQVGVSTAPVLSAVAASNLTASGATIGWTTNKPADTQVDFGLTSSYGQSTPLVGSLVTSHSATLSGLSANTTYHFMAKSRDAGGNLGNSLDLTFTTLAPPDTIPPTTPTGLSATGGSGQVNLAWTISTDNVAVTGYLIERCQGAGCSDFAQVATAATASYSDTAVAALTSYRYRVRATDAASNLGAYSNIASATTGSAPPTAPANLTATPAGGTQVNLTWTASTSSAGIQDYSVERCQGVGCTNFAQIAAPVMAMHADTGLTSAITYSYRVRARDLNNAFGGFSNTATATTLDTIAPTNPSNLVATAIGIQVNLTWTASTDNAGVAGYQVERCQGAGCAAFVQIATTAGALYSDGGLAPTTSYSYRVRAADASGNLSGYSNAATAATSAVTGLIAAYGFNEGSGLTTADASPNGFAGTLANGPVWAAGKSGNALTFDGVDDRVSVSSTLDSVLPLTLEAWVRPTSFAQWRAIFSKRASYSPTGMRFDVGLRNGSGSVYVASYSSLAIFAYAPPLNAWTHLAVVADSTGTRLYANGVLQETLGVVTLGSGATAPVSIGRAGDGDDPFAGMIDDLRLYSRSLTQSEIQTDMDTPVTTAPAPTAPSNLTATLSGTSQIDLSWTASTSSAGILNYVVERCQGTGCSSFAVLATSPSTSYSDTGMAAGISYSYRVRATDVNNIASPYSNTAGASTPDTAAPTAPANLLATAFTGNQINLTWTPSTDNVAVVGYRVERCQGSGCSDFAQVASPATASYSDTGLTAGAAYRYRVRATDAAGNLSGYSDVATATTPAPDLTAPTNPAGLAATAVGSAQINLTWTASTDNIGVTGYQVERCQGVGCATFAPVATPTGALYNDAGLAAATSYSYRVRATDASGNLSGYSNMATAATPAATGLIAAYGFNEGSGLTTADASPNGFAGTLANGPVWAAGKNGNALTFDGVDDRVSVSSTLDSVLPLTLEAWVRPTSFAQWRAIFSKRASYSPTGMRLDVGLRSGSGSVYVATYSSLAIFAYAPPLNAWTHLAVVADSTGTRLYANGVLQETLAVVTLGSGATAPVSIGRAGDGDDPFAGMIDDLRLYGRSLSLAEIQSDMNTPITTTPPPTAPANLTATLSGTSQIDLSWTASTSSAGILNYVVERCQGTGCSSFAVLATSPSTSYSDTGIAAGISYSYRVRATDVNNIASPYSNTAGASTPDTAAPTAPANLLATAFTGSQINLTWTPSTDNVAVVGYRVERCQGSGCSDFAQVASPATASYNDTGLTAGAAYRYRVRATDAAGNLSGYSNVATATTPAPDLTAPTNPAGLAATAVGSAQINLTWTASTDNIGVTGYQVERCQGVGCATFAPVATPAGALYNDAGLAAATSYSYRVRATDASGNLSGYSNVATAATPAATGLIAAYGFNEGSGVTTADASPNGFAGTLANGPVWAAGKNGNALSFDGADDRVSLSNTLDVSALPFTMEAWVRPTGFAQWRAIFSKRASYSAAAMRFDVGLQSGNGRVYLTTYTSTATFTYAPPLNTWTHLAVVADATGTKLYVNGVLQQTLGVVTLGAGATAPVSIGRAGDGDDPFAGSIDDFRLYGRSLSQAEIQSDMNTPVIP